MGARLTLVIKAPDRETVETLTRLLEAARSGTIIGLAYVALHHHHEYSADLVGQALSSPLLCRGICRCLEDAISRK